MSLHEDLNIEHEDANILNLGTKNEILTNTTLTNTTLLSVEDEFKILKKNVDVFFLIAMGTIIFLMQGGFAFLEAGSVRSKNTTNILLKNLLDVCIGAIVYWLVGYPFAYGEGNFFWGWTGWASYGVPEDQYAHWFFQFVFAATTATIISGAMAERCGFVAYLVYSAGFCGFVYPVVSHWAWSPSGWLFNSPYHDFAGSGAVHLTSGVAAFVGCWFLGPRDGRFGAGGGPIKGHSVPMVTVGGFILLFGFLAFNGGSQGTISNKGDAEVVARSIINTVVSGSGAALSILFIRRFHRKSSTYGKWSFMVMLNGGLTGMVSACAGCNALEPWGSFIMGVIAGPIYYKFSKQMEKMKVDDPLDAVAVHAGGGIWGLMATPIIKIFNQEEGASLILAWNVAGALSITVWTGVISAGMFGILSLKGWLRVSLADERAGLDLVKHNESAYPAEAWKEDQYAIDYHILNTDLPQNMSANISVSPSIEPQAVLQNRNLPPSIEPQAESQQNRSNDISLRNIGISGDVNGIENPAYVVDHLSYISDPDSDPEINNNQSQSQSDTQSQSSTQSQSDTQL